MFEATIHSGDLEISTLNATANAVHFSMYYFSEMGMQIFCINKILSLMKKTAIILNMKYLDF